jgi:hypothetical protein
MRAETKDAMACALACVALACCGIAMGASHRGETRGAGGSGPMELRLQSTSGTGAGSGTDILLSANFGLQYSIDASSVLNFPRCLDTTGNPVAGCVVGWRICGSSGTATVNTTGTTPGTVSSPFCVDVLPGQNNFNLALTQNIAGQTTPFPVGSATVTATLPNIAAGSGSSGL